MYLPGEYTYTSLQYTISPGSSYTIPADGFYTLGCHNSNGSLSAVFSINGIDLLTNGNKYMISSIVPLKKGTVIKTRANVSSNDFHYMVLSSFTI